MQTMQESGRIVRLPIGMPFEIETDQLVGWDLQSDLAVASTDEIEADLALGDPAWGSLMRVNE
jgi:hypothetical protein